MKFEKVLVTPQMASDWLSFNKNNRPLRPKTVKYYALEMVEGRWRDDTGETIKFDPHHNLIDGQHRLAAIVKSEVSISLWVAYDVIPEAFQVIDSGLKRGATDVFAISSIPYPNVLPPILRYYRNYKANTMGRVRDAMSSQELVNIYNSNPIFWQECAKNAERWHKNFKPLTPTIWGFLGAILVELNNDEAMDFLDKLSSGRKIEHDGMYFIRDRFVSESVSAAKTDTNYKIALILKLWNSIRAKNPVKSPKYDPFNENFPLAI